MKKYDLLYGGNHIISISPGKKKVGMNGVRGRNLSTVRPASENKGAAKLSNAAYAASEFITGHANGLYGNGVAYVESGDFRATFDGSTLKVTDQNAPEKAMLVVFLWALCTDSVVSSETETAIKSIIGAANSGIYEDGPLYYLSDSFFYECWFHVPDEIPVQPFEEEQTKQAIRTFALEPCSVLKDIPGLPEITLQKVFVAGTEPNETPVQTPDATPEKTIWANCKAGKYRLDWEWTEEQVAHIKPLAFLDGYVPPEEFFFLLDVLYKVLSTVLCRIDAGIPMQEAIGNEYVNAILNGNPGTGKTEMVSALSAALGLPVWMVNPNPHSDEDLVTGMTKVSEGGFKFFQTPFLKGFANGGICLIEEFNLTDAGMLMSTIGQAIEKPHLLMEDQHIERHRHPLCVVISTMNQGTIGSQAPNQALVSRSPLQIKLEDPDAELFVKILMSRGHERAACEKVYMAYTKLVGWLKLPSNRAAEIAKALTMRSCFEALRLMSFGCPFKKGVMNTMIGTIGLYNTELAKQAYRSVIETMRN